MTHGPSMKDNLSMESRKVEGKWHLEMGLSMMESLGEIRSTGMGDLSRPMEKYRILIGNLSIPTSFDLFLIKIILRLD